MLLCTWLYILRSLIKFINLTIVTCYMSHGVWCHIVPGTSEVLDDSLHYVYVYIYADQLSLLIEGYKKHQQDIKMPTIIDHWPFPNMKTFQLSTHNHDNKMSNIVKRSLVGGQFYGILWCPMNTVFTVSVSVNCLSNINSRIIVLIEIGTCRIL